MASSLRKRLPSTTTLHIHDINAEICKKWGYVSSCNNLVAAEGMALRLKYGIDKHVLWKCMTDGTANSWVMHLEQPVPGLVSEAPSSNGYRRAFTAGLGLKDLGIGVNSVKRVGLDPTAGEVAIRAL